MFLWLLVWLPMAISGILICYFSTLGKMTLSRLKSIPAGFLSYIVARVYLKESSVFLVSIIFRIRTRKCTKLFTESTPEYFSHVQTVCTRPLLGGEGPGDEANLFSALLLDLLILNPKLPCNIYCMQSVNLGRTSLTSLTLGWYNRHT